VRFLWAKGLNAKGIHKEMFPVYVGKFVCHVKQFHLHGKHFADDEVETKCRSDRETSMLLVSTHW
jgi:hypothetical protein